MALSFAETFREDIAEILFGGVDVVAPTDYDLGLFTGDPNNGGVECTGTGYARIPVTNEAASWAAVAGTFHRSWRNDIDWIWTAAAGAGWGTPNWVCFYVQGTSVILFAMEMNNAIAVQTGDPVRILAGDMMVQFLN